MGAHLERCAPCRARVLADDPTRLFALLGRRPVPAASLDEVAATVAAAVAGEHPEAAGGRLAVRAVAAAAAAILAVAGATLQDIRRILTQGEELGTVKSIYFEGGEPFLYYAVLVQAVREAAQMGFSLGVVSNAYWATTIEDAIEWLKPMARLIRIFH